NLDAPALGQEVDAVVGACDKTGGGSRHLGFLQSAISAMAPFARGRCAVAAERGDAAGMQFGIGYRPAFLLDALGAEHGIALHRMIVLLALTDVCRRAWVGWGLRLRRSLAGKSDQQRGRRHPRKMGEHCPSLCVGCGADLRAISRIAQSTIVNPPLTLST